MADELKEELKRTKPERQAEFKITPDLTVHGNRNLPKLVLENLPGNALKFTGESPQAMIEFGMKRDQGRDFFLNISHFSSHS